MENFCDRHDDDFVVCEHISECISCFNENRPSSKKGEFPRLGEDDIPVYYCSCFYCVLQGNTKLDTEWDSYSEVIEQVMQGFHIGFRDGMYNKPKIDGKKCKMRQLAMLYNEGYQAGVNARAVVGGQETCSRSPEVVPNTKKSESKSPDDKSESPEQSPKNKDPTAKALRKLLRSKEVDSSKFTYDTETYPKCVIVLGDTKDHKDVLKELGGKWNGNLKCGKGWMFSKSKLTK
jgi:hypothetical protein